MEKTITIQDKTFTLYISNDKLEKRIFELAQQINKDFVGKSPIFLAVLNGCFFFAADLVKDVETQCEVTFIKLASYHGASSTGNVNEIIGIDDPLEGRDVIILEDIVDSGKTMKSLLGILEKHKPANVKIATLLFKKDALVENIQPDYIGFEVENEFLVGFGLDYLQYGRNLKDLYILKQ